MLQHLRQDLNKPRKIIIVTHYKPDGDAMGSSLGLYHYLKKKGHEVSIIVPSDYPQFLWWLPGNEQVIIYQASKVPPIQELLQQADYIFCLDFNNLSRINDMQDLVARSSAVKVMIDHHLDPSGFEKHRLWDIKACATAELIFQFIAEEMGDENLIDTDIATCLYTGIVSDSGSFKFPNTRANVHRIVASLMDKGLQHTEIHRQLFENQKENSLRFLGFCITERLEIAPTFHTAIMCISKDDLRKYNITTGDTEGLVNVPLSIKDIQISIVVIERPDMIKLSMRSKGDIPVNEICAKYFNGGGHKNASGGSSSETLENTRKKIYAILEEFAPYLQA